MSAERWLPVPGYEHLYEVSDLGSVRSLDHWADGGTYRRLMRGRVLKPQVSQGYLKVFLSRDGEVGQHQVGRLVLEAFDPAPPGCQGVRVVYGPGGPQDNRLVNLMWSGICERPAVRRGEAARVRDAARYALAGYAAHGLVQPGDRLIFGIAARLRMEGQRDEAAA